MNVKHVTKRLFVRWIGSQGKPLSSIKSLDECKQQQIDLMDVGINNRVCVRACVSACVLPFTNQTGRYNILSLSWSSDPFSPLGSEQPLMDSYNRPWWRPWELSSLLQHSSCVYMCVLTCLSYTNLKTTVSLLSLCHSLTESTTVGMCNVSETFI